MGKMLKHEMVPKHEVLSEKEAEELLNTYNVIKAQLPSIFITDPVIKSLDANEGEVIKITRKNPVVGTSYAFRVVTPE